MEFYYTVHFLKSKVSLLFYYIVTLLFYTILKQLVERL